MYKFTYLFFALAFLWSDTIPAQTTITTKTSLFGAMRARQLGPAVMSGRVSTIAVHPDDATTIYIGAGRRRSYGKQSVEVMLCALFLMITHSRSVKLL